MSEAPEDPQQWWRVWAARRVSRARQWEEGTCRALAQIGISHEDGHRLLLLRIPAGLQPGKHSEAQRIIRIRRALRTRLWQLEQGEHYPKPQPEEDILRGAAQQIAVGADVYGVMADLTVSLTSSGLPERMFPNIRSPRLWDMLLSRREVVVFAALRRLPQTDVPDIP